MEGLGVERVWLDEDERAILLTDTKSGAQTRVIGETAIELLLAQPPSTDTFFFPDDFFPVDCGDGHFIGDVRTFHRFCASADLASVTPHTLRHTIASLACDWGFSELTVAALLGYAARGVTQCYIQIDEALRMTVDPVASEMADILDGRAPAAVSCRSAARQIEPFAAHTYANR